MTPRAGGEIVRSPFFLDRNGRRLFVIHFRPRHLPATRRVVVFFNPFAEEMNRSRRMSTLLAEALAADGAELVVFDYWGTGDSDGEFADARLDGWVDDGVGVVAWTGAQTGGTVDLLGLRFGAALALATARTCPERIGRTVLWQPVLSGSTHLTQFLRLRVAQTLTGGPDRETTQSLRARLAAGERLEVAGYTLDPALTAAIDAVEPTALGPAASLPVDWMELAAENAGLAPASRRVVDGWRSAGARLRETTVAGELFWTTQDMTTAPALVAATVARLGEAPP